MNCGDGYEITENSGGLHEVGAFVKAVFPAASRAFIVTDQNVYDLYYPCARDSLEVAGFGVFYHVLAGGEHNKQLFAAEEIYKALSENEFSRNDIVVALGGGVVGDIAGFAAATYMRGIGLVQIPTTLVAQTDSSVGGKNGVNYGHIKNMIGSFYQPGLVYIDTQVLKTLDRRQYSAGMAEVIKYGCIRDLEFFDMLLSGECDISRAVMRCCNIKRDIVERDEHDRGERHILNYGHTVAHAIEACTDNRVLHGEAVAAGMYKTACMGEALGITEKGTAERIGEVCSVYGLSVEPPLKWCDLERYIRLDKKRSGDMINEVFLTRIGNSMIKKISVMEFAELLHE